MLKGAKPIEVLLAAPVSVQIAMVDFVDYMNFASELHDDITERFNYPSLWAAIGRLIDFTERRVRADIEMRAAGFTFDDAFTLHSHDRHE